MSSAPRSVALPCLVAATTYERVVAAGLDRLKLPAVAINPEPPATDVESLARHGIRTVPMSGVGHFPMLEDPERFDRLLRSVLEELVR
jgi:pimeloyl-ACP methyl ester carboxylesterase